MNLAVLSLHWHLPSLLHADGLPLLFRDVLGPGNETDIEGRIWHRKLATLHILHLSLRNAVHHRLRDPKTVRHLNWACHLGWDRTSGSILTWNGKILAGLCWCSVWRYYTIGRSWPTRLGRRTVGKCLLRVLASNSCLHGSLEELSVLYYVQRYENRW